MIRPPGFRGAAFTTSGAGDMRRDDRSGVASTLGISAEWATVRQVHGSSVRSVDGPGWAGEADAVITDQANLPVVVFTADCGGVVLEAPGGVAAVHAGWRGAAAGVVAEAAEALGDFGGVERAALGPTIGPCCFEVGDEVAAAFPEDITTTTWGTTSVDLPGAIRRQLPDAEWWVAGECTMCGTDTFSHRRDATTERLAAIGWMP